MNIACLIPGGLGGTQKAGWLFAEGFARRWADPMAECQVAEAAICSHQSVLQKRKDELQAFAATLPHREWHVFEKTLPDLLPSSQDIYHRERQYARRYQWKKRLSALRADLRSLFGKPAYQ